jgi:hypothetical protein
MERMSILRPLFLSSHLSFVSGCLSLPGNNMTASSSNSLSTSSAPPGLLAPMIQARIPGLNLIGSAWVMWSPLNQSCARLLEFSDLPGASKSHIHSWSWGYCQLPQIIWTKNGGDCFSKINIGMLLLLEGRIDTDAGKAPKSSCLLFLFLCYWGLNSVTPWATPSALFCEGFFRFGVLHFEPRSSCSLLPK